MYQIKNKGVVNMKRMLSNGNYAMNVNDFEQVMNDNDFNALVDIINTPDEDAVNWEQEYKREERHSDALYSQNMSAYNEIEDLVTYLLEAKRMNKAKILDMLREIQNTLENY